MLPEDFEVEESRSVTRFIVEPPILARIGRVDLSVFDFGEGGLQAQHAEPIRLGTRGTVELLLSGRADPIRVRGEVVWSHLSQRPSVEGKLLYRTGFRMDDDIETSRKTVRLLLESCFATPDTDSLRRKKRKADARSRQRESETRIRVVKRQHREIAPDILLLVQHARAHLQSSPQESAKWYNRARFSLPSSANAFHHREEVLAIWEFLERSVPLEDIAWVIDHG